MKTSKSKVGDEFKEWYENFNFIDNEAVADWWLSKFDTLLAKKREEISRLGAGLAEDDSLNTEYEKGYYGAKEDIIKILS